MEASLLLMTVVVSLLILNQRPDFPGLKSFSQSCTLVANLEVGHTPHLEGCTVLVPLL